MKKLILNDREYGVLQQLLRAIPPAHLPQHIPYCNGVDLREYRSLLTKVLRENRHFPDTDDGMRTPAPAPHHEPDYSSMPTEALEAICRADAESEYSMEYEELAPIVRELARRRREEDTGAKTAEQAWADFIQNYLPANVADLVDPTTGVQLTPSWHGVSCAGNGQGPDECCCDQCDWLFACFPDWRTLPA